MLAALVAVQLMLVLLAVRTNALHVPSANALNTAGHGAPLAARAACSRRCFVCAANPDDAALLASLEARKDELTDAHLEALECWREGYLGTYVGLAIGDWIRRVDMDTWPLVALGTAEGEVLRGRP